MKTTFIGLLLGLLTAAQGAEPSTAADRDISSTWQQLPITVQVESTMQEVKKITGQAQDLSDVTDLLLALDQSQLFQSVVLVSNQWIDDQYHFEIKATLIMAQGG